MQTDSSNFKVDVDAETCRQIKQIILGELRLAYMDGVIDALNRKERNPDQALQERYKKFTDLMAKFLGGKIKQ